MPHPNSACAQIARRSALLATSLLFLFISVLAARVQAASETVGDTFPASLTAAGAFTESGVGQRLSISDDGRYVAFTSASVDFAADARGDSEQAYVKDLETGEVVLASRADGLDGPAADEPRSEGQVGVDRPLISGDGRYLVFDSPADNLVAGFPPSAELPRHVYRRDLQTGETVLVDRATGPEGTVVDLEGRADSISDDGRYVAFTAAAEDLEDPGGRHEEGNRTAYVRDLQAGTTVAVGRASDDGGEPGELADAGSSEGQLSGDGRYLAFASSAANLDPEANGFFQVYRRDLQTGETILLSRASAGEPGNGESFEPAFVGDGGCRVAFTGFETTNLSPGPDPLVGTYLRDLCAAAPTTGLIGLDGSGTPFDESVLAGASGDGRHVLLEAVPPGPRHLYLRDLISGQTTLVDRASGPEGEPGDAEVGWAALAANGCRAAFTTQASNLTAEPPPSPPEAPHPPAQAYVRQLGQCAPPPEEAPTGKGGGQPSTGGAGSGGMRDAAAGVRLRIERLNRHSLWLDFSGAATAAVRIERLGDDRRQRKPIGTIAVSTAHARLVRVSLPHLAAGRYRVSVRLRRLGSPELVRFLEVDSNTLRRHRR